MDRFALRRQDYSLTDEHTDLQAAYRQLLRAHCTLDTVRAAETAGFDKDLWERLCAMGVSSMAVPEPAGGDGATLVDLTLVAEELGRSLAPVPWIDHACAIRLLAALGGLDADLLDGRRIAALDAALRPVTGPRLIAAGAVADDVIVRDGAQIVRLRHATRPPRVDNIARLPMAWIDPALSDTEPLGGGDAASSHYRRALDEWRLLTAAALVGLVEETMTIAAEFARTRYTLGVPIGTLQGISHPLADIAITVAGGRNLVRRAAWYLDNEPDERPELPAAAFVFMAEEATKAATTAAHVQGGLGVSAEAASSAYLLRARGWPLAAGDPAESARAVAEIVVRREARPDRSR